MRQSSEVFSESKHAVPSRKSRNRITQNNKIDNSSVNQSQKIPKSAKTCQNRKINLVTCGL